ncbi:uncharacterized protein LOC144634813 isoform X2 [Oculina patagonica]
MNCLYAAFPAEVLEVLSLGSILVTPRTQELNITIPPFCCNVTVEKRQRMIKDVLAALQDLAVSPSIRDPRLNSAECVTEGHKPNILATGRSAYIRAIIWCSFISVLILGPLLAFYALNYLNVRTENCNEYCACCNQCSCCYEKEKPLVLSVYSSFSFLLLVEIILVIYVLVNSAFYEFYMLIVIILEGFVICMIQYAISKMQCCTICHKICEKSQDSSIYRRSVFVSSANMALYHLFWLMIGIMINPIWGLTVLLVVCFVIVALFYTVFMICDVDKCCSSLCIRRFSIFPAGFLGLCLAAAVPVLAGQSFFGRETADDILKTMLLYVINFLALWMYRNAPSTATTDTPVTAPTDTPVTVPTATSATATNVTPITAFASQDNEVDLGQVNEEARPYQQTLV